MNEQLRELVKERLSGAVNCPAKDDVVEEITADLTEKYNDLLSGGMEPEAAMEQMKSSIGDLSEVADFINEANRRSEESSKASNNPFAALDDLMRQLGRSLKPSMKEVAGDLKSAAGHLSAAAKGVARETKGPLSDIAREIKDNVKSAAKAVSSSFDGRRFRYDYTVPAAELTGVEIRTSNGDVTFGVSQDDNIYIVELSASELTEEKLARIATQDGVLHIAQGQKYSAGTVLFNYGMMASDFEVYLPQRQWDAIRVTTTSGDVELEREMKVGALMLRTTSGDLQCPDLECDEAELQTISGDVRLTGNSRIGQLSMTTVSGDAALAGSFPQLTAKTTSGDLVLNLSEMPQTMDLNTVSGDTRLHLPDNDGFTLRYQRVSGDVRSDFDLKTSLNAKSGTAVYLSGGDRHYSMQTISGDLRIFRR